MKRSFICAMLAFSLIMCSCGANEPQQECKVSIKEAEQSTASQTTTSVSSQAPEQTSAVKAPEETTASHSEKTTAKAVEKPITKAEHTQPVSDCESSGFAMYETDTQGENERISYVNDANSNEVKISLSVKSDLITSGLRDIAAERKALEEKIRKEEERIRKEKERAERQQNERLEKERLEKERIEREKLEKQKAEQEKLSDQFSEAHQELAGDTPQVHIPTDEELKITEMTASSVKQLTDFLSKFYTAGVVGKYEKIYNESFFKANVVILKVFDKPVGSTTLPRFCYARANKVTKQLRMELDDKQTESPLKTKGSSLFQTAVSRTQYNALCKNGVKYNLTYIPYYNYPLAKAKLDQVGWDLKKAFTASHSIPYYGHRPDIPQDNKHTIEWYANFGFTKHKGNCYVMASMFCEMARLLGYRCQQVSGTVALARGGYGAHSWCEIIIDGESYVCDPNFTNETPYSGFMRHYWERTVWQYRMGPYLK